MTAISSVFKKLRAQGNHQPALIPFITAGDPDLETTAAALQLLDRSGADLIELGVPYADPLADGPVIQSAATRALQRGTSLDKVLKMVTSVTPKLQAPVILFTYYNPILNRGIQTFLKQIVAAGISGLVVPDLPIEEAADLLQSAASYGIDLILLVAPTSSTDRIERIVQQSQGFVYLVSVTGVTGMRHQIQDRVKDLVSDLQQVTDKPIALGFGISQPEQAHQAMPLLWAVRLLIVWQTLIRGYHLLRRFVSPLKPRFVLWSRSPEYSGSFILHVCLP
jgi:tryptophan synthase alpha chain